MAPDRHAAAIALGVCQSQASRALSLMRDRNRHPGEVKRPLHWREVGDIDRPGLLGGQPQDGENSPAAAPDTESNVAQGDNNAPLGGAR